MLLGKTLKSLNRMPVRKFEEEDHNGMLSKNKKAP